MIGESWLAVEMTSIFWPRLTSQAQPEPKRPVAAVLNCSLNFSKPQAKHRANDAEAYGGAGEGVEDGGDAPAEECDGVADAGADAVDQAAGDGLADGVGGGEGGEDVAVLGFADVVFFAEVGGEDSEDLSVDVVDGGADEEEGEDGPAEVGGARGGGVVEGKGAGRGGGGAGHGEKLTALARGGN